MFLAGDEFCNTQNGNNNCYCQDNEMSWLDWSFLEKNRDIFEFFKFMIAFRWKHPVIRKKLPNAVCGMEPIHCHDLNPEITNLPPNTRTFSVSFAGYNREKGQDDIVYISVNTYWEDVRIELPKVKRGAWYLSVNTYGDSRGRYCYPEGKEVRVVGNFILRPRSVAVFTWRFY